MNRRSFFRGKEFALVVAVVVGSAVLDRAFGVQFPAAFTFLVGILAGPGLAWTSFVLMALSFAHLEVSALVIQWFLAVIALLAYPHVKEAKDLFFFTVTQVVMAWVVVGILKLLGMIEMSELSLAVFGLSHGAMMLCIYVSALFLSYSIYRVALPLNLLSIQSPDSKLLKLLATQAPGTYHHSLMVGVLAEEAGRTIGNVDLLLLRLGGMFHDIGKLDQPHEFTENQVNEHPELQPDQGRKLVLPHPEHGAELARQGHFPKALEDIIAAHLGTSVTSFYYQLPKEEQLKRQAEFRYPGPKPTTREQALVMLADGVEAAARSHVSKLDDEDMESLLRSTVKDVVTERLSDGQLDQVHFTDLELKQIQESFTRTLTFEFHTRVGRNSKF